MGILNLTPDSFSDGGQFTGQPIEAGLRLLDEGADLVDVGGESTRPGAAPVPIEEEWSRIGGAVAALAARGAVVSVDTAKPEVARRALEEGAQIVNDVTGLGDPEMRALCAERGCGVCIMHMRGTPRTMQVDPTYRDVVRDVRAYLKRQAAQAIEEGVLPDRIWVDPGIGFGKSTEHNCALVRGIPRLASLGFPVLIGVSRKSFIGWLLGSPEGPLPTQERLPGTLAAQVLAQALGAKIVRTHDVAAARQAMTVASCICASDQTGPTPASSSMRPL